jgi:ABC-type polar amino acid transport system ATPase subunit
MDPDVVLFDEQTSALEREPGACGELADFQR